MTSAVDKPLAIHEPEEHCLTCSDDATRCTVVRPPVESWGTTLVDTGKGTEEVDTTLVGHLRVGDTVLVHAKTAIARLGTPSGQPASDSAACTTKGSHED